MTSYILLTLLVIIVAFGVIRAAKQPKANRRKNLPSNKNFLHEAHSDSDPLTDDLEDEDFDADYETADDTSMSYDNEESEQEADMIEEETADYKVETENEAETQYDTNYKQENEVITITLRAADNKPYNGYELLQALLTSGLRYSRTGVFHRYNKLINRDEILFSLMSAVAPGTFELPKMGGFSSPALTLFMQTAEVKNPAQTYNMMLATAKELIEILGGHLLDENKQSLTEDKVNYWQGRLRNLATV
jgi:cell division protein ZipA